MSGVLGFTNLLLDTSLDDEQREFAQVVQRSGNALLNVLNDVLDYSKIEAGRMSVERIAVPLRELCEGAASILRSAAQERGVELRVEYDARLPALIKGDPLRIRQVLLNLAGNAVKFTQGGSVSIGARARDPGHIEISVEDTGIGIPEEQMARLFTPYVQADSNTARRYGGTGLGLVISKNLVELMGGEIGAESGVGRGSKFWFVLPLEAAAPEPVETAQASAVAIPTAGAAVERRLASVSPIRRAPASPSAEPIDAPKTSEPAPAPPRRAAPPTPERTRVLLVEDNFVNQRVAMYMLTKLGYPYDVARDGREALERLRSGHYGIVLMDCQMPEMDGFEATRRIRDPRTDVTDHDVPIIAMTANAFPEDRARSMASGMNDFLSKPVDQATLSEMIVRWVRPVEEPSQAAT
jgi:CheY-like chemotaxis protein/anti-sigma regulatory factor (Ser/Thr protein kinase)